MVSEPICECEYIEVMQYAPAMIMRRPDCPVHGDTDYLADLADTRAADDCDAQYKGE